MNSSAPEVQESRHTAKASDGTELSYRVVGNGPHTVMLIHGWMTSGAVYDDVIPHLTMVGQRLIVPDLRGTGESGRPESGFAIEQYARDVEAIADAVGLSSFVVVGHSMGGQIAQWLAASLPGRVLGVVLLCSVPASGAPLPPETRELFRTSGGDRQKQGGILDFACKELSAESRERLLHVAATIPPRCIEQAFHSWVDASFSDKLSAIKAPTLVVGTDDPALPYDFLKQMIVDVIPGAVGAHLPGPGHYIQVERPRETAALLRAFLAALRP